MSPIETKPIVEQGACIGKGTTIGESCFIGKNVKIGKNNTIAPFVVIDGNTIIGDSNIIGSYTVLGSAPQDIKTATDNTKLHIGSGNMVGEFVFVTAGTEHGGRITYIGDNCILENGVHVGHDASIGNGCRLQKDAALGGHVVVGEYAIFEKNSSVHQFVHIGSFAKLKVDSVLTQDLPPYCIAQGNRAKILGLNREDIEKYHNIKIAEAIKKAFKKLFYATGLPKKISAQEIKKEQTKECMLLYSFILDSKRGIPFKGV